MNTVSARQIQRGYKKVLEEANKINEPIIVISNNKPLGAVIGLEQLEKLRLEALLQEGLADVREGRTKTISTDEEFEEHMKEIDEMVNQ